MNDTERLIRTAKQYVKDYPMTGLICAYAGGSVGRGQADAYSDLDLVFCVSGDSVLPQSRNISYNGNIIQLDVQALPTLGEVTSQPWDHRFLSEARIIYDPDGFLHALLAGADTFFKSEEGRKLTFRQAVDVVEQRKAWLQSYIDKGEWMTAGVAANAVWTDALLLYIYFVKRTLSTGGLLSEVRGIDGYDRFQSVYFSGQCLEPVVLLHAVREYRAYLRDTYGSSFDTDPIQDELVTRKTRRAEQAGDYETIAWQLKAEAFWCYLTSVPGHSLEQHFRALPDAVNCHLVTLGFRPYSIKEIQTLLQQADYFITLTGMHR